MDSDWNNHNLNNELGKSCYHEEGNQYHIDFNRDYNRYDPK